MISLSYYNLLKLTFVILLLHFRVSPISGHKTSAYSHESSTSIDHSEWLSSLPDEVILSSISLPGTHESLSRGHGGDIAECQTLTLESQLKAGIRVLDVRCRHVENSFAIHHGVVFMHIMFGDVLDKLDKFLKEHPKETVLMRVKEEYHPVNVTVSFEETFQSYYDSNPNLFWHPDPNLKTPPQPTLGSVRGKIVVLDNFSSSTKFGLNYDDRSQFVIQDDYRFTTNWDLYRKWEETKTQLNNADVSRRAGENKFFLNYLSGAYGAFPYFVASGHITSGTGAPRLSTGFTTLTSRGKYPDFPRIDCFLKICTIAFEGTNVLTMQFLDRRPDISHVGLIMMDFPGDGLISKIISLNYKKLEDSMPPPLWAIMFIAVSVTFFGVVLCFSISYVLKLRNKRIRRGVGVISEFEPEDNGKVPYLRF